MNHIINFLICLFLILANSTLGQNLVKNGDFELIDRIPDGDCQLYLAKGWYSIHYPVQLYHTGVDPVDFNDNYCREENLPSGNACALIYASEYGTFQTKLSQPLEVNKEYRVSFHIKLSGTSHCALTPVFGMLTQYSSYDSIVRFVHYEDQVSINDYKLLLVGEKWHQISGTYLAKGNEKYLSIGYFNTLGKSFCKSVYFFDDISVCGIDNEIITIQDEPLKDSVLFKKGAIITMDHVSFNINKSTLLPHAFVILDSLSNFLVEKENLNIRIDGYTDNLGDKDWNNKLSLKRAKAVYNYLLRKGVNKNRMKYFGLGSLNPTNNNTNEIDRQNNRRVEIIIL